MHKRSQQQAVPAIPEPEVRARIARDLETHGLKATRQRMLVAGLLLDRPRHLTAEQILSQLKADGLRVSKATVYNTLKALTGHGLVRQINLRGDHSVYDSTCTPHHHFHDEETGELFDIAPGEVEFMKLPPPPDGKEPTGVDVVVRIRRRAT
jgi:Fur family iron response transcriptional regulator